MCISLCKRMSQKMNLSKCESVYEQESKYMSLIVNVTEILIMNILARSAMQSRSCRLRAVQVSHMGAVIYAF